MVLPLAVWNNPNVNIGSTDQTKMHRLHVLVHKGVPGGHNSLAVFDTAAGNTLCTAGYVGNN